MIDVNILRMEDVLLTGIEFTDDVCFSGNSGQEVFDYPGQFIEYREGKLPNTDLSGFIIAPPIDLPE
ncbi:hypothetical protein ACFTRD_30785, partial [Paenibacillus sp. NPDC056933]|uniref:hypothetical protein n=1 Tax=Paenibacillus sp. NPDC056933 TaxID=3345968 RepID=UPI003632BFF2